MKTHRRVYYDLLQRVREEGAWDEWLAFFLDGVRETSEQATDTAKELLTLFDEDRKKIAALGRPAPSALRVHDFFQSRPVASVPTAYKKIGNISKPTIRKSIGHLIELDILSESTGKQRNKIYTHARYLEILCAGTEPI